MTPKLSILVVVKDAVSSLPQLFTSLNAQTAMSDNVEVVFVVDPATTDSSHSLIVSFCAGLPCRHTVLLGSSTGLAAGWNDAIAASRATLVCRLDAHGEYPGNFVERLLDLASPIANVVVGGPVLLRPFDESREASLIASVDGSRLFSGGAVDYKRPTSEVIPDAEFVARGVYHRSIYELVGPYRSMPYACEDTEWAGRARRLGVSFVVYPELVSYHSSRPTIGAFSGQKRRNGAAVAYMLFSHGAVAGRKKVALLVGAAIAPIAVLVAPVVALPAVAVYGVVVVQDAIRCTVSSVDVAKFVWISLRGHVSYLSGAAEGAIAGVRMRLRTRS